MRYPNLVMLDVRNSEDGTDVLKLVIEHSFLTHLKLWGSESKLQLLFWDKLLGFHSLKNLTLSCLKIGQEDIDRFSQLYT